MRSSTAVKSLMFSIVATASMAAHATPVAFSFNYLDSAGEGFNDPGYGVAARSALEYAGALWGNYLSASYIGETIRVDTFFNPLGTTVSTLAQTSPANSSWNNAAMPIKNTIFVDALANHIVGKDLNASKSEIKVTFNTDKAFYFGTDFNSPSTEYNFLSIAMHEVGHGLGFTSRIDRDNSDGSIGGFITTTSSATGITNQYPSIYDRFLVDAATGGAFLTNMTDAQRAVAITGGSLYWAGAKGVAANGGVRPELYAPNVVSSGSSVVHFDPVTHFLLDSNAAKGEDVMMDPVTLGVLADIGWSVTAVPEPHSYAMLLVGLAGMVLRARRALKKQDSRFA